MQKGMEIIMIRSDNHVHTSFSTDSDTPMEAMVQRGIELGLSSVCFTDHIDYDFPDTGNGVEFLFEMEPYFEMLSFLQGKYPQFEIRRGVELGLKPDLAQRCNALIQAHPFDFVIGSTHLVDNADPYYPSFWEQFSEKDGIRRYYEITMENIRTDTKFDVYGHIDYIIRYTPTQQKNKEQGIIDEAYMDRCFRDSSDMIDEILRLLLAKGKGIEVNTAGIKYGLGHTNPQEKVLKRYRELGGEIITVGSDAHETKHLAYAFEEIPELLRKCGFRYYTEFRKRKPEMIPL